MNGFTMGDRISVVMAPMDGLPPSFSASAGMDAELVGWTDAGLTLHPFANPNQVRFYPWTSIQFVSKGRD